jgi:hypothetical protein
MVATALSQERLSYAVMAVSRTGHEMVLSQGFPTWTAALDFKVKRACSYSKLWVEPVINNNQKSLPRLRLREPDDAA